MAKSIVAKDKKKPTKFFDPKMFLAKLIGDNPGASEEDLRKLFLEIIKKDRVLRDKIIEDVLRMS